MLVDVTGWQGLFWIDAGVAVGCMVLTCGTVTESSDPDRPRSIDYAGTVLIALTLTPLILGVSKSGDWGWLSVATLGCFAIAVAAGFGFIAVEKRVAVPLLDLALLRNRVLVGSTIAILIGAGTINGLMYLLSLYFQNPAALGLQPAPGGAGDAAGDGRARRGGALGAASGRQVRRPADHRHRLRPDHRRLRGRSGFVDDSWKYAAFLLPLIAIAVGMGLSNGPASSAATACGAGGPGRRGLRGLQHGAVRRRRGRDGPGRHDLRQPDRRPDRRRRVAG